MGVWDQALFHASTHRQTNAEAAVLFTIRSLIRFKNQPTFAHLIGFLTVPGPKVTVRTEPDDPLAISCKIPA